MDWSKLRHVTCADVRCCAPCVSFLAACPQGVWAAPQKFVSNLTRTTTVNSSRMHSSNELLIPHDMSPRAARTGRSIEVWALEACHT